jgi:DnaJ-class molecular chaperone
MTPGLRYVIDVVTCPRCAGCGVLHSRAVKYRGEPYWETHRDCDLCRGSGINPTPPAPQHQPELRT